MATEYFEERAFVAKTSSMVSMAGITVAMFVAGCSFESSREKKSDASLKIYFESLISTVDRYSELK
jgi:Na+/H+ antiporter NhaA